MTMPERTPIAPSYTRFSIPATGAEGCVKSAMGAKPGDIPLIIDEDSAVISWGGLDQCRNELLRIFAWVPITDREVAETIAFLVYGKVDVRPKLESLLLDAVGFDTEPDNRKIVRKEHLPDPESQ